MSRPKSDRRKGGPGSKSRAGGGKATRSRDGAAHRKREGGSGAGRPPREDARSRRPAPSTRGYWVPGERAVRELLEARPNAIKQLCFELGREIPELEARAASLGIRSERKSREDLEALVGFGLARGVVARAEPPPIRHLDELLAMPKPSGARRRLLVALDQVVDPGNLGAILRSAEFFGAVGVLWAKDRSAPLSPLAVRASAGATERLPLCVVTNLSRALETAKQEGWWVVGTLPEGDEPMGRVAQNSPDDLVVVLGGEHKGMRRVTVEACDFKLRIPRVGMLASLNVSAAAAVVLSSLAAGPESASESTDLD